MLNIFFIAAWSKIDRGGNHWVSEKIGNLKLEHTNKNEKDKRIHNEKFQNKTICKMNKTHNILGNQKKSTHGFSVWIVKY